MGPPGNILSPNAIALTKFITKALLRWILDVAIFLLLVIAFIIWRSAHVDREAQREEVWRLLKDEIQHGDAAGVEERMGWFVERLRVLENKAGGSCEIAGSVEREYGACEMEGEEDEWMRAGREMAIIAEEGLRLKRLEGQEERTQDGSCEFDPASNK